MTRRPWPFSPGYLRAVRRDALDWERTRKINLTRAKDEAERKAREAERAAVLAELERNLERKEDQP